MKQKKFTLRLLVSTILILFSFSQIQAQDNSKITGSNATPGATQYYNIEIPSFAKELRPYIHIFITGGVFESNNSSYKKIFTRSLAPQRIRVKWDNSCNILNNIPGQGASISAFPSAAASIVVNNRGGQLTIVNGGTHPSFPAGGVTLYSNPANLAYGLESYCSEKQQIVYNYFNNVGGSRVCETIQSFFDQNIVFDTSGCCNLTLPEDCSNQCETFQTRINTINNNSSLSKTSKLEQILKIFKDNPSCDLEYCD